MATGGQYHYEFVRPPVKSFTPPPTRHGGHERLPDGARPHQNTLTQPDDGVFDDQGRSRRQTVSSGSTWTSPPASRAPSSGTSGRSFSRSHSLRNMRNRDKPRSDRRTSDLAVNGVSPADLLAGPGDQAEQTPSLGECSRRCLAHDNCSCCFSQLEVW